MKANTHMMDNQLDGEWLQARPGEDSDSHPLFSNEWFVLGYRNCDVNHEEPDPEAIISLTRKMIATGVTTYLSIITAVEVRIIAALQAIAEARRRSSLVSNAAP